MFSHSTEKNIFHMFVFVWRGGAGVQGKILSSHNINWLLLYDDSCTICNSCIVSVSHVDSVYIEYDKFSLAKAIPFLIFTPMDDTMITWLWQIYLNT